MRDGNTCDTVFGDGGGNEGEASLCNIRRTDKLVSSKIDRIRFFPTNFRWLFGEPQ